MSKFIEGGYRSAAGLAHIVRTVAFFWFVLTVMLLIGSLWGALAWWVAMRAGTAWAIIVALGVALLLAIGVIVYFGEVEWRPRTIRRNLIDEAKDTPRSPESAHHRF